MREYDCLDDDATVRTDHEHLCGECRTTWFGNRCLAGSCDLEPRAPDVCPDCSVAALADWLDDEPVGDGIADDTDAIQRKWQCNNGSVIEFRNLGGNDEIRGLEIEPLWIDELEEPDWLADDPRSLT